MPFVPKNAAAILKNAALQKEFFLKPYGLTVNSIIKFIGTSK